MPERKSIVLLLTVLSLLLIRPCRSRRDGGRASVEARASQQAFTDSVVVAKALSYRDAALAVVKVRQTHATGFELHLQLGDESSCSHTSETGGYLVIERGRFRIADGTSLESGTVDTDPAYPEYSIAFSQAFRGVQVVMTGLTNTQEPMAVTGRPTLISEKGLQFQLRPQGPSPASAACRLLHTWSGNSPWHL
jgi:hypothetical protein